MIGIVIGQLLPTLKAINMCNPRTFNYTLANPGIMNLVMIEVQSGDYVGEDDIVRFEDTYGRV